MDEREYMEHSLYTARIGKVKLGCTPTAGGDKSQGGPCCPYCPLPWYTQQQCPFTLRVETFNPLLTFLLRSSKQSMQTLIIFDPPF